MEERLKQRLIGVLLLALLAAILAPLLLRSPEEVRVALDLELPEEPRPMDIDPEPVIDDSERRAAGERIDEARDRVRRDADAYQEARKEAEEEGQEDQKAAEKAADAREPELSGWAVQLGSFGSEDNARAMAEQLRDRGQNAFVRSGERDDGEALYRVFAGPELERDAARALRDRLADEDEAGVDGLVVPLDP